MLKLQQTFTQKVAIHRDLMNSCMFEREAAIHAAHIAMLARKNMYLLGPGGEGKTQFCGMFAKLCNMKFFGPQFHSFFKIDEWDGPTDLEEFKNGKLIRKIMNFAPGAQIILADEIGRGGAVLSCLYRLLNEGTYMEDGITKKAPIEMVFAGSNSMLPAEHDALFDRFPFFFEFEKVSNEFIPALLMHDQPEPQCIDLLNVDEVHAAREEMKQVVLDMKIATKIQEINTSLEVEGIHISTRLNRWTRSIMQASAYCDGRAEVGDEDIWILRDVYARTLKQKPKVNEILRKICNQELDTILFTFDEIQKMYNNWNEQKRPKTMWDGKQDANVSDILKGMRKDITNITPKKMNLAEHTRVNKIIGGLIAEVAQSEINIMRMGKKG